MNLEDLCRSPTNPFLYTSV